MNKVCTWPIDFLFENQSAFSISEWMITMPYIPSEVVAQVKHMDLLTCLHNYESQELLRLSGNVYYTRTHDSLKISNAKWCWHSRGIGARSAHDYLIKVRGMGITEAVEQIMG